MYTRKFSQKHLTYSYNKCATCPQIKYDKDEKKLLVTVERCEHLKKESGLFGGNMSYKFYKVVSYSDHLSLTGLLF